MRSQPTAPLHHSLRCKIVMSSQTQIACHQCTGASSAGRPPAARRRRISASSAESHPRAARSAGTPTPAAAGAAGRTASATVQLAVWNPQSLSRPICSTNYQVQPCFVSYPSADFVAGHASQYREFCLLFAYTEQAENEGMLHVKCTFCRIHAFPKITTSTVQTSGKLQTQLGTEMQDL